MPELSMPDHSRPRPHTITMPAELADAYLALHRAAEALATQPVRVIGDADRRMARLEQACAAVRQAGDADGAPA